MENNNKISSTIRNACIVSILAIIAAISFYFCYWTQRPMYAIQNIVIATQTGDTELFKKHVDLKSIYGDAYDTYIDYVVRKKEPNIIRPKWLPQKLSGNMAYSVLKTFKSDFIVHASDLTLRSIEKRKNKDNANTQETTTVKKDNSFTQLFIKLLEQVAEENNLSGLKAEDIFVTETKEDSAEGIATFKSKNNDEPLRVKFIMSKYNNVWKITKISNVLEIIGNIKKNPINIEELF